jgi:hypothetical protein
MIMAKSREPAKTKTEGTPGHSQPKVETAERGQANPLWHQLATRGQAKLTVGAPDDSYEREADAMADKVMRMPDRSMVQPKCADCEEEGKVAQTKPLADTITPLVQSAPSDAIGSFEPGADFESRLGTSGGGSPLPASTRAFMEPRFGTDFSAVRLHRGSEDVGESDRLNRELGARAFTFGSDVYLSSGARDIEGAGRKTLAHEMVHVVQQRGTEPVIQRDPDPNSGTITIPPVVISSPSQPGVPTTIPMVTIVGDPGQTATPTTITGDPSKDAYWKSVIKVTEQLPQRARTNFNTFSIQLTRAGAQFGVYAEPKIAVIAGQITETDLAKGLASKVIEVALAAVGGKVASALAKPAIDSAFTEIEKTIETGPSAGVTGLTGAAAKAGSGAADSGLDGAPGTSKANAAQLTAVVKSIQGKAGDCATILERNVVGRLSSLCDAIRAKAERKEGLSDAESDFIGGFFEANEAEWQASLPEVGVPDVRNVADVQLKLFNKLVAQFEEYYLPYLDSWYVRGAKGIFGDGHPYAADAQKAADAATEDRRREMNANAGTPPD